MRVSRPSSRVLPTWAATIALLAVLFQALASGAMAHTVDERGVSLVICSAAGASTVVIGADGQARVAKVDPDKTQTKAGPPCQDCVGAATPAIAPPEPVSAAVRYARQAEAWRKVSDTFRQHARAPPRPPSRAPPSA